MLQRVGGDWRNLPEPWSRALINQCLNNCRALQTFCSQWPGEGRDEVEDRAREVTHPSPVLTSASELLPGLNGFFFRVRSNLVTKAAAVR